MTTAAFDLLVVGAGVFGLATALEGAARGLRVGVVERDRPANPLAASYGPSRKIKSTYLNASYARLGVEAMAAWGRIERDAGEPLFIRAGNLVYTTQDEQPLLDRLQASSEAAGGSIERLDHAALRARFPAFRLARSATFEPAAGFIRASNAIAVFVSMARAAGITLLEGTAVERLDLDGARPAVLCGEQRITAERLVVAGGVWSPDLVPELRGVITLKRQGIAYLVAAPAGFDAAGFPPFSVAETNFYGFPAWGGHPVKFGWHDEGEVISDPDVDRTTPPRGFIDSVLVFADQHLGVRLEPRAIEGASCLYDVTPTTDFLVDFLPGSRTVLLVTGGSGHGFKFGSVIGRIAMDRLDGAEHGGSWLPQFGWERVTNATVRTMLPVAASSE